MAEVPRLQPDIPLPPYSYVPGKFPHPISDPEGHSYRVEPADDEVLHRDRPARDTQYERGIDLFNHGFYWESHEAWEPLWLAAGRKSASGYFLQGLIKLAAALVKAREGREQGVARHAERASQLFNRVPAYNEGPRGCFMGLRLATLVSFAEGLAANPASFVDTRDEPVVLIGGFVLRLEAEDADA